MKKWLTSKRFTVYLICVLISTLIWLLIKLTREYNTQFPVELTLTGNPGEDWMIVDKNAEVVAEVSGFGFDLLSYKLFGKEKIEVDVTRFNISRNGDNAFILIPEPFLIKQVNRLMKGKEKVMSLYPATIRVDLSHAMLKKVPVKLRVKLNPENGFKIKGKPVVIPDSIEFFGPANILSKVEFVNTLRDSIGGFKRAFETTVPLDADSLAGYLRDSNLVVLKVDVDELTSGSIEIPVEAENLPNGKQIKVLPSKVKIYYQVGLSDYQKVVENLFKAQITLPDSKELPDKLKVNLVASPQFVEVKRIEPLFVEYLLKEK